MNASIYVSMPLCIYIYIYYKYILYKYILYICVCVCNSSAMYLLCLCGFHFSAFQAIHFPALQATNPPTSMINLWILGVTGYPLKVDTTPPFPCAQPRFFVRCELEGPNPRQALRGDLFQARWPQWELEA